ncbi:exportin 6 [Echinococcus multilocularis]|uniref:Exportin 6 n=1 Tax=Echinococcus multilocularis TaxID=6211 RepID=A0A068Y5W4_ECHMU|nr:exportin 6 [Echinococcus multilocularis]
MRVEVCAQNSGFSVCKFGRFTMTALAEVQSALTEFYAQASSPERLAQLQESLIAFEQQPSSWMAAIHFLTISSDQYVCIFSLGIIESTVKRRWTLLSNAEKHEIFQFLEKYAFPSNHHQPIMPSFLPILKCKAIKIWTSICKKDFVQVHMQFLARIINLLTVPASVTTEADLQALCLSFSLFKAAYEELLRQDSEISQTKVTENALLFGRSVPQLLVALFEAVERLLGGDVTNSVKTMFSTPLGCISEENFLTALRFILYFDANILFSSSTTDLERKLSNLLLKNFANFLECLTVLLTVSPNTAIDQCRLYSLLYIFLVMGSPKILSTLTDASRSRNLSPNVPVDSLAEIGMHSLNCLTEVAERKDFQRDVMAQHLPFIFRILYWDMLMLDTQFPLLNFASSIINIMVESGVTLSTSSSSNNLSGLASVTQSLESISEDFYQKLVDILRPLVTVFLLFSKSPNEEEVEQGGEKGSFYTFSPTKFLQRVHFFTFTVCRSMTPVYLSALDLWNAYLDFVKTFYYWDTGNSKKQVQLPSQTQRIISSLCSSLLITIYFSDSASYLDVLDSDYPSGTLEVEENSCAGSHLAFFDDTLHQADSSELIADNESEYAIFMQTSLTLLSAIAFFNPTTVLHSIAAKFQEGMSVFTQLCNAPERMKLEEHTTRKLHYALRDLATCLNCLAYLSDHFGSLQDISMLRWLLEALVFNLKLGVAFCDRLKSLQVETLQQDVVQVVVENISLLRCLLTSGFVLVSEVDTPISEVSQSYVVLSVDDKDAFSTSLLQCIHHLLLVSPIASLRLHAALLFQTLVAASSPPRFSPPSTLLSEGAFLADLITCCCEPSRLKTFSIPVQRLLVRAVTAYLLIDETAIPNLAKINPKRAEQMQALTAQKNGILMNSLMPMFSQALHQDTLTTDRGAYFAGLCWLNEALASLIPLGSKSRRLMYDTLTSCGILNRIWQCLETTSLSSEVHLFIAHLSFFVQFTDIYGSQRSTASMIPGLITTVMQLLQLLERNTATARLVSPVISHLLHLLNRLVQNRTVFPSMAIEVLRFISNCLVVNLAGGVITDLPSVIATASKNDPDLCLRVFRTLFNTASYAYSQMTAEVEHLATFLRPVLAVFTGEVFDPRLLIACADAMVDLNARHRLFTLPAFVSQWRNQFSRRFLALLVDGGSSVQQGSDSEASLIRVLHGVYCSPERFAINEFCETAVEAFLVERIPLVGGERPAGLTAAFSGVAARDLNSLEEFSVLLSGLLTERVVRLAEVSFLSCIFSLILFITEMGASSLLYLKTFSDKCDA